MSYRILFVASLHHPQTLQREQAQAQQSGTAAPLFPSTTIAHFWEKAMLKRGYVLDVFWRNISGFASQDISTIKAEKYTNRITFQRIARALAHRLPYQVNLDIQQRNKNFRDYVQQFQPDILFILGDNHVIHNHTLEQIKAETNCRIIYTTGTSPIVFSHPMERKAAPLYDLVLVNDYYHGIQYMELGAKDMICSPGAAVDPDFHYPRQLSAEEEQAYQADISFVGTLLPDNLYSERVYALEALADFDLGIWSVHDVPPSLQRFYRGSAIGDTMLRVLSAAKLSINTHGNFMRYGGNMRLFELASINTFQIVDDRPGIHEWFTEGEHLVIYRSLEELKDLAAYYLAHPQERKAIAHAAREHVLEHHNYEKRLSDLEDYFLKTNT